MNKKIIKTASVIAVGAGAAALYKGKFAVVRADVKLQMEKMLTKSQ